MGNFQAAPSAFKQVPEPIMSEILEKLPEKDRFQVKRVSREFHAIETLDTKVAFVHKSFEDKYDGYKVYFRGYRIYFVDSWALITQIISTMHRIKHLALVYCDFDDWRFIMTTYTRRNIQKIRRIKLYHTIFLPEFRNQVPQEIWTRMMWIDRYLLINVESLTEFVYKAEMAHANMQEMIQAVINCSPKLRRLALNFGPRWTFTMPEHDVNYPLISLKASSNGGIGEQFWQSLIATSRETLQQFICEFHLAAAIDIQPAHVARWWSHFQNLRDVRLGNMRGLPPPNAFNLPLLEVLAIHFAPLFHPIPAGEQLVYTFQHRNRLRILDLGVRFTQQASLETIANSCPLLEILIIRYSFQLTDDGVTQLLRLERLQQLTIIGQITDRQMARCARYLLELRVVCSEPTQNLNYQTFLAMAGKARKDCNKHRRFFVWAPNVPSEWGPKNMLKINESLHQYLTFATVAPFNGDYFLWRNITDETCFVPRDIFV